MKAMRRYPDHFSDNDITLFAYSITVVLKFAFNLFFSREIATSEIAPIASSNKNGCLSPSGTTEVFIIRKQGVAIAIRKRPNLSSILVTQMILKKIKPMRITAASKAQNPESR